MGLTKTLSTHAQGGLMLSEWLNAMWLRINALFRRRRLDRDLNDELQFHLAMREQKLADSGVSPEEAHYAARREFGNATRAKEANREMWTFPFLETLWQDIRYGLRQLRRNPGFTAVAVITLALGIGANSAIFSLANAAFFRRLPFPHANRLAFLWQENQRTGETEGAVSYPNYADWRAQSHDFEDMAFIMFGKNFLTGSGTATTLLGPNGIELVPGALVSTNFFSVLGVSPVLGRGFTADEATPGHIHVAVISYGLWRTRFGADAHILRRQENFGGGEATIIGVMPRGFTFPTGTKIWKPREINTFMRTKARQYPNMAVIGRLKAGVVWAQARAEMNTIANRLAAEYPAFDRGVGVRIVSLREQLSEKVRTGIVVLWAFTLAVLLIACLNTAALIVGRTAARQKEIAVRFSLGATRQRLARQLVSESLLLALAGAFCGVLMAGWSVSLVSKLNPAIAQLNGDVLQLRVLVYTAAVALIAALICGVIPLFAMSRIELGPALKQSSGTSVRVAQLTRKALVVVEVAIAVVLLVGSGLLIRSLRRILSENPGFDASRVLTFRIWPMPTRGPGGNAARTAELSKLFTCLKATPGINSISSASFILFPDEMYKVPFEIKGQSAEASGTKPLLLASDASPRFFQTMGIPLLRGREFNRLDTTEKAAPVAIVNQAMARRYWQGQNPIGMQFRTVDPNSKSPWFTIVGVIGDVREEGLEKAAAPIAYVPSGFDASDEIVIRTAGRPQALAAQVRAEIHALDKYLVISHMRTGDSMLAEPEAQRRFNAWLLSAFAFVALVLGTVGIYGVLAYWVSQRLPEIGVRMALGAQRRDVLRLVVHEGMSLTLTGLCVGIVGALGLAHILSSLLYGVKPTDPLTFIGVSTILTGVALVACYIPARRATRVDPIVSLRYE
jgi:predicted permease